MAEPLLSVEALEMRFGGIVALHAVSFTAQRGAITSVIGPNGAGKTTLFNCATGMYRASAGRLMYEGEDLVRLNPTAIARRGIARTFQNIALFEGLSIEDNLVMGAYRHGRSGLLEGAILSPRVRRERAEAQARAQDALRLLGLAALARKHPSELSYGMQKRVEFARALMQRPRLILLDEPMAGMTQVEKNELVGLILDLREKQGISFLVVEHDMPVVMGMSDHIVVLDFGKKIAEGNPEQVSRDEAVIAAYLGADDEGEAA